MKEGKRMRVVASKQTQGEVVRGERGQGGHLSPFKPTLLASDDPGRGAIV